LAFSFGVATGGGPAPEKVRAQIFELTNEFRKSEKMEPLKLNDKLGAAAQKHADNLARRDKFGDDGMDGHILDGENGKPRIQREGYRIAAWAENVAMIISDTGPKLPFVVMEKWKKSPGHRENLLFESVTETGIGAAKSKSGKWYFCQVFGKSR
jgi:uncharacterized protein YkwD